MDDEKKETETEKTLDSKKVFVARLIGFLVFAMVLPIAFIAWRYGIFSNRDGVSLSGWGIIGVVIAVIVVCYVMRQVASVIPYSLFGQCVSGFMKVIVPLLAVYIALGAIKERIEYFEQALAAIMICEAVAIPMNPIPKWVHDHMEAEAQERTEKAQKSFFAQLGEWWKHKED